GFQRLSSSNGSDATIATCSSTNVHSEWYQAVAQIPDSLHSNMFSRESGASSSTSWTSEISAGSGSAERSRDWSRSHSVAASVGDSSRSSSATGSAAARDRKSVG